jgi:hypothetical protein
MLEKALMSLLTLVLCSASGQAQKSFSVQDYLANLEYYKFANVHIFETDRPTAQRLLELIPKENIWQVFVITTKANSGEVSSILGAVATPKPSPAQRNNPDFVSSKLARVDIGSIFTSEQLRGFPSQSGSAKEFIAKPLGKSLLEHCAANIKQSVFANVTASLRPQFSLEVADLAKKGVFVVQPRGILTVPKSVAALPPDKAAFAVIDDEALPHLTRWQWLGTDNTEGRELLQSIHTLFRQNGKPNVDSTLILTGVLKKNGKYDIYEIRCGVECLNKLEITNAFPMGMLDVLRNPADECVQNYDHAVLTVALKELPLPLIPEEYAIPPNNSKIFEPMYPKKFETDGVSSLYSIRGAYIDALTGRNAIQAYKDYQYFTANPNAPRILRMPVQPSNFTVQIDLSKFAPLGKDEYWAEGAPAIDYYSDSTDVQVFLKNDGQNASWSPSPVNFGINKSEIKGSSYIVSISVRDLPVKRRDEERILQGSIEIKALVQRKKADGTTVREAKRIIVPIKQIYK